MMMLPRSSIPRGFSSAAIRVQSAAMPEGKNRECVVTYAPVSVSPPTTNTNTSALTRALSTGCTHFEALAS